MILMLYADSFADDISENELNNNNNNGAEFMLGKTASSPPLEPPRPGTPPPPAAPMQQQCSPPLPPGAGVGVNAGGADWYGKPEMLPFLSLCSRYSSGPWAGLLQQTIKEKQKLGSGGE